MFCTRIFSILALAGIMLVGSVLGQEPPTPPLSPEPLLIRTSWYGGIFHLRTMANGKIFHKTDPSVVAHRAWPFSLRLKLRNPENGRTLTVTVQDRGPYINGRGLDVSEEGAKRLGFHKKGVTLLEVEFLD